MSHLSSDKYTIAWFKLAEFVSRGEKERALGIYRLLVLSIDDPAFSSKLEGDILSSFKDNSAIEKYNKAAMLYQKDNRFIEAAAVYETLSAMQPDSLEYLNKLSALYNELNFIPKVYLTLKSICLLQIKAHEPNEALNALDQIELIAEQFDEHEIIFAMIENNKYETDIILGYIKKLLNQYFLNDNKNELQQFLTKLEILNTTLYLEAIKQIEE